MILNFSVENYKSFKNKQDFSFVKLNSLTNKGLEENYTKINDKLSVLNTSLIYGRNASGKSNFLESIYTFRELVSRSTDQKLNQEINHYKPFKFDKNSKNKPTKYWIEFLKNDVKYKYHVEFNNEIILKESLTYYPNNYPANLFDRELNKEIKFGTKLKGEKKSIENQLLDNQLFLSKAANNNHKQLQVPYLFISNSISPLFPSDDSRMSRGLLNVFSEHLADDENTELTHNLNSLIKVADTGIQGLLSKENLDLDNHIPSSLSGELKERYKEENKFELSAIHKLYDDENEVGEDTLKFEEESSGTKKLASLGGLVILTLSSGGTLIIDELDNSLHPRLTKFLIGLFHSKKYNKKNAQLLFATHDVSLLSSDLFRRDQVWFVEKDKTGSSELYSLSDFKGVRNDVPLEKWYLSGKFGATPVIDELEFDLKFDLNNEEEETKK